jgi:hypothetical protein
MLRSTLRIVVLTDADFVDGLRTALPEAFVDSRPDEFEDADGALPYSALGHAVIWLEDNAVTRRWFRPWRVVAVRPATEDAMRRFWDFIEHALGAGTQDTETLVLIECFEHDDWAVATRFMGSRTRALLGDRGLDGLGSPTR